MILDFFGISIRASRFFHVLSKLRGMAIYWGREAVLKPDNGEKSRINTKKKFSKKNNKLVFNSSVIVIVIWG